MKAKLYVGLNAVAEHSATFDDEKIMTDVARHCGGFTRYLAEGGWINPKTGVLELEKCAVWEICNRQDYDGKKPSWSLFKSDIRKIAQYLGKVHRQKAVLIVFDGAKSSLHRVQ